MGAASVETDLGRDAHVPTTAERRKTLANLIDKFIDPTGKGWIFKGARDDAPASLDAPWRAVREAAGLVGDKHAAFTICGTRPQAT